MTDWLALCREAVEDVRGVLVELPTRTEREPVVGDGEGGDETTAIDAAAERVILERLRGIEGATIVSEEVGILEGDGPLRIVVDPIDGSLNAKRGIPFFSVSSPSPRAPPWTMSSSATSTTSARRGVDRGARQGRAAERCRLGDVRPKEEIEILSFEATLTSSVAEKASAVVGLAYRLRSGLARAFALPSGRRASRRRLLPQGRGRWTSPPRSCSCANAASRCRCGSSGGAFEDAPLDLVGRSRIVAAATPEVRDRLFAAAPLGS